jgi:hypothetical protein
MRFSGVPHALQKRALNSFWCPHWVHAGTSVTPHAPQKRFDAGFSAWHAGHSISAELPITTHRFRLPGGQALCNHDLGLWVEDVPGGTIR